MYRSQVRPSSSRRACHLMRKLVKTNLTRKFFRSSPQPSGTFWKRRHTNPPAEQFFSAVTRSDALFPSFLFYEIHKNPPSGFFFSTTALTSDSISAYHVSKNTPQLSGNLSDRIPISVIFFSALPFEKHDRENTVFLAVYQSEAYPGSRSLAQIASPYGNTEASVLNP